MPLPVIRPIVISAPSGAGKTTLRDEALRRFPLMEKVITATTRSPREGEINGRDYHFLSPQEFQRYVEEDQFIEYTNVHGKMYGCLKSSVGSVMERGRWPAIILDVVGKQKFDAVFPNNASIFIHPPAIEILEERIRTREPHVLEEEIQRRLGIVKWEIETSLSCKYSFHMFNNGTLEHANEEFCGLIDEIVNQQ